ncbi:MAG: glycosyltransferase [Merismopedia sp. SIO2A8]|nr:glycosyltransferase [Symploca sp. SIO2B6]NET50726.1 glycosyltransferase [Merismopedia sp. SIO2A8]
MVHVTTSTATETNILGQNVGASPLSDQKQPRNQEQWSRDRPLKIVQIIPSISVVYGGPSQMIRGFSQALAAQGASVTILTTDSNGDSGQAPLDVPLDCPVDQDGYTIRYFRCSPFKRYKFSAGLLRWLYDHAHDFDLAHIHALFSPVSSLAAAIARHRNLPYILRPLGTLDPADLKKKRHLKRLYATLLERPNMAAAAGLHFTSSQENQTSERFGTQAPGFVIPLGVTPPSQPLNSFSTDTQIHRQHSTSQSMPSPFQEGNGSIQHPTSETQHPKSKVPTLLFMSRIAPKKGLDLLLPALENLVANGQKFHFVLAGSNPQDPNYEKAVGDRIQTSSIGPYTTITGFVEGEQKATLLQQADLFVLPSYYENFGISVAEAMVAGTPVVISDQVHIAKDVQHSQSGWICSCDVGSLTMQLLAAIQNPEQRQQRGTNAQRFAKENYSWDAIAQQTLEVYHSILQQTSQHSP